MEIRLRAYRDSDLSRVVSAINASSNYDGTSFYMTEEEFQKRLAMGRIDNRLDVFVADSPEGELLGYAEGFLRGDAANLLYATRASVLPQHRRMGVGGRLLEHLWQQAQSLSAGMGGRQITFAARVSLSQTDARQLLERFGMQPVRYFYEMVRDLSRPVPDPQPPIGIELQAWGDERLDHQVWEATEEAFKDHWRHIPVTWEKFQNNMRTDGFDREHSFVALDGNQVIGGALNFMGPHMAARRSENQGQIGLLFVSRAWRKRGVGSALVLASLQEGLRAGHGSIVLNVDAENLTGAVRLYESLGFTVAYQNVVYERKIPSFVS